MSFLSSFLLNFKSKDPVLLANHELFRNFDQTKPLPEYEFTVFDTELTGLNKHKDEIISIGAVKVSNMQILPGQTFYSLVKPEKNNPNEATFIHRLTPEELRKARPIAEVLPDFIKFCGGSLLVGHFLGIDMHFLNKATQKELNGTVANPGIDTMRLTRGYKGVARIHGFGEHDMSESYALDDLRREFKIPSFAAHNALEDAMQTAYLFLFLIKKMKKGGAVNLKDLYSAGRSFGI